MTIDAGRQSHDFIPFILRFAERMDRIPSPPLRYDESRQVAQVEIDGRWIDTPDAPGEVAGTTRMTKVEAETTDDQ